jgi:hypothetical protein
MPEALSPVGSGRGDGRRGPLCDWFDAFRNDAAPDANLPGALWRPELAYRVRHKGRVYGRVDNLGKPSRDGADEGHGAVRARGSC